MLFRALSAAERAACWGGPLGSQLLWRSHATTIDRILQIAGEIQIREPAPDTWPVLQQLPEECLREVALRYGCGKDRLTRILLHTFVLLC